MKPFEVGLPHQSYTNPCFSPRSSTVYSPLCLTIYLLTLTTHPLTLFCNLHTRIAREKHCSPFLPNNCFTSLTPALQWILTTGIWGPESGGGVQRCPKGPREDPAASSSPAAVTSFRRWVSFLLSWLEGERKKWMSVVLIRFACLARFLLVVVPAVRIRLCL